MSDEHDRRRFLKNSSVFAAGTAVTLTMPSIAGAQTTVTDMQGLSQSDNAVGDANALSRCPIMSGANAYKATGSFANQHWWPNQLNLKMLHQNARQFDPLGSDFNYAEAFKTIDLDELQKDLRF